MSIEPKSRLRSPVQRQIYALAKPLIERTLRLRKFRGLYETARERFYADERGQTLLSWSDTMLATMGLQYEVKAPQHLEIPASGPLVIVANQPFGVLDACMVAHFVSQFRADVRLIGPSFLSDLEEFSTWLLPFDLRETPANRQQNHLSMQLAREHLQQGGVLIAFPAEDVAHWQPGRGVVECHWGPHVARLVRQAESTVLPIFLPGRNSAVFQTVGLLHGPLRRRFLTREFTSKRKRQSAIIVGQSIGYGRLKKFHGDAELTSYLRLHTLVLGNKKQADQLQSTLVNPLPEDMGDVLPLAGPCRRAEILAEVQRLQESDAVLAKSSHLNVIVASAEQIPHLLQEIGRQREITFRLVGEGTGREVDLDAFDDYYLHLFLWDNDKQQLAGAYRLGRADVILKNHGKRGLYTSTLFKFRRPFLEHLKDAVEMGRSFITPEYQRTAATLPLLWKGICVWISRNPQYRKLFGPVSISQDYHNLSQNMLIEFLKEHRLDSEMASHVRPRQPFKTSGDNSLMKEFISAKLNDIEDCSALISSLEQDQKGIPVLLKHYLKLNGTLISFNVDKDFSSVVDGLILVDLTKTQQRILMKYMGEARCQEYLAYHGIPLTDDKS